MKTAFTICVLAALAVTTAPHIERDDTIDDTTVLNFALALEHLENAFYSGALAKFSDHHFWKAGLPKFARGRFAQIAEHEAAYVAFLSKALGDKATQHCNCSFPYTDAKSFAGLSQAIEGVGVSAYTGAAQFITDKTYLTAAASVLTTEARHASWVASAVNKSLWALIRSTASPPPSSRTAPHQPLAPHQSLPRAHRLHNAVFPGKTIELQYTPATPIADGTALYAAFYSGLSVEYAKLEGGKVVIPDDLRGQVYAVVTTSDSKVNDGNTIAGPAILLLEFDSRRKLYH